MHFGFFSAFNGIADKPDANNTGANHGGRRQRVANRIIIVIIGRLAGGNGQSQHKHRANSSFCGVFFGLTLRLKFDKCLFLPETVGWRDFCGKLFIVGLQFINE